MVCLTSCLLALYFRGFSLSLEATPMIPCLGLHLEHLGCLLFIILAEWCASINDQQEASLPSTALSLTLTHIKHLSSFLEELETYKQNKRCRCHFYMTFQCPKKKHQMVIHRSFSQEDPKFCILLK